MEETFNTVETIEQEAPVVAAPENQETEETVIQTEEDVGELTLA